MLLRKEQAGFGKGRGCADQISTLQQIVEQSNEWSSTVYANFTDFTKAFDSVQEPPNTLEYPRSLQDPRQACVHHQNALQ